MFKHYLTNALRHFRQHKVTTSINVVCLTIGLVCFLSTYAAVMYYNSGEKHFANADRIYMLLQSKDASPGSTVTSWVAAKYLQTDFPELETVARATFTAGLMNEMPIAAGDRKSFMQVAYADAGFLDVFALPFLAGDSRDALRAPRSAVISKGAAIRLFGATDAAVGHNLRLQDGRELTVRGVLDTLKQPSHIKTSGDDQAPMVRFDVLVSMDVYEADTATQQFTNGWDSLESVFTYVVLPRDGSLTLDTLKSRLVTFAARHTAAEGKERHFDAVSVSDYYLTGMGSMFRTDKTGPTLMFYFLGAMVLLISCLNYANLATAHASTRAKEIGMRRVVGARRGQVATQFLLEAALLALTALLSAIVLIATAVTVLDPPGVASTLAALVATPTFWVTLFSLLVAVTLVAGAYPAFVLSSVRPIQAMRAGKVHSGGRFATSLMVCLQFVGATLLLISMLVMNAQNREYKRSALRGTGDTLVDISNDVSAAGIDFEALRSQLLRQPHIQAVTAAATSPWTIATLSSQVASLPDETAQTVHVTESSVHYDFFSTLGIKLLAGRVFDRDFAHDAVFRSKNQTPYVSNIVVDQALAEQNGWSHPADALGKILYFVERGDSVRKTWPRTVVGVVENRSMGLLSFGGATASIYQLDPTIAIHPVIRVSTTDSAAALSEIQAVWDELAPSVALKMQFADDAVNLIYESMQQSTATFSAIASLALFISILGLIGMSMHVIGRRRHEIGLRKTLGASVYSVVRLLLLDFSKPVLVANVIAWPVAFIAMQGYLSIFSQRIGLTPVPFIVGLVGTVLVAWFAVAAQATRAARLNPATVLRHE